MSRLTFNTDVDLDLNEIYSDLDYDDKHDLVDWLISDRFIKSHEVVLPDPVSVGEEIFREGVQKLLVNYSRLSIEQLDYIEKLTKFL